MLRLVRALALLLGPALVAGSVAIARPASAKTLGKVTLPDSIEVDGTKLVLNGLGMREATMFSVDVYVAGLYVRAASRDAKALIADPGPKRLELRFVRDVDEGDMVAALKEGFQKTGSPALAPKVKQLCGWMRDLKVGDRLVFTFHAGAGVEVEINGKRQGSVAGDDVARALLAIWLGPEPPNAGLKAGLLGG